MQIIKPRYYDRFQCIAGACPDSCCKDWTVAVDETSAAYYRSLPGPLGDRLREVLREEDGDTVMAIQNGRCPMWREDGLCRIQAEMGEEALCQTCSTFPRLTHDYGHFACLQLELSCPVAAQLILEEDDTPIVQDVPGGEEPDYDPCAMQSLLRTRAMALDLLADRSLSVKETLAVLLLFGYAAQNELDGGEDAMIDPKGDLLQARSFAGIGNAAALLGFYGGLEILTDRWRARLCSPEDCGWPEGMRALARYFVDRYWLQAVSDYDLVGRVKLILCSCLVIKLLGGDLCQTAQLYSKEIENDANNIDAILDGAYESAALTDAALLGLLLNDSL